MSVPTDLSGAVPQNEIVDVSGSVQLSEEVQFVISLLSGEAPKTRKEAVEVYHQMTIMFGTWVVSDLPAIEQKAVLASLWLEKAEKAVGEES